MANPINQDSAGVWGTEGTRETLVQVVDLCGKGLSIDLKVGADGCSFRSEEEKKNPRNGVLSVHGKSGDDSLISVRLELVRTPGDIRVPSGDFFKHLSSLGDKVLLLPPQEETSGLASLWVELNVKATPMSMARASAFLDQVRRIDALARLLQAELPMPRSGQDLLNLYKDFSEALEPVFPLRDDEIRNVPALASWARATTDFLAGGCPVAVCADLPILLDIALAALAAVSMESGISIGLVILPSMNPRGLLEIARKAPGTVAVAAVRISLGTNPYELANETRAFLSSLSASGKPVICTGSRDELQALFGGGQGVRGDPLSPVVRQVPDLPIEPLILFTARRAGAHAGGLSTKAETEITAETAESIAHLSPAGQLRILPSVVRKAVGDRVSGKKVTVPSAKAFASTASGLSETLTGLCPHPRGKRTVEVQECFTRVLTDPALLSFLMDHLLAQDHALGQLVARLRTESLTRPLHQPIRYCAQGTPATGKSESAVLLAERLGIPYVNIDAASMPDSYTAASQLLGSGRGIVMSHQPGRLEQVAKHHAGALVEVSDLDHAVPSVRSVLADLFLQVLETGEAQSATGAMFSCANVIFAFTMNLPGGADESVRKGIGFGDPPSRRDVRRRVVSEIKDMLSGAFVSRIGTPILFEPLDGEALAVILERAVTRAILSAAERLRVTIRDIAPADGLGARLLASLDPRLSSFGARALLEHGRSLAAEAVVDLHGRNVDIEGKTLRVSPTAEGTLVIEPE